MAYHKGLAVAAAAALSVFAAAGLSRSAPQLVRRGDLDLSSPYIPPARHKPTAIEKQQANARMEAAKAKRARKAARYRDLVAKGGLQAAA